MDTVSVIQTVTIMATILTIFTISLKHISNKDIHLSEKERYVSSDMCETTAKAIMDVTNAKLESIEKEVKSTKDMISNILFEIRNR